MIEHIFTLQTEIVIMPYRHINYTLTRCTHAWRHALSSVASLLPQGVSPDDLTALRTLPIFALIVVIDNATLAHSKHHPDELMRLWADHEPHWTLAHVHNDADITLTIEPAKEAALLSDVSVFRYLLLPSHQSHISADKKDAAAHILDEQVTSYLRKKLLPTQEYSVQDIDKALETLLNDDSAPLDIAVDTKAHIDCHIVSVSQMIRTHKLACFDMDSTLIKQEVIVELAKMTGTGAQVDAITESAMRGEIDFATSFRQRVALLKDTPADIIDDIKPLLIPQAGAFATIKALKALGYHTALVSGGFVPFAHHVAKLLDIDEYHANELDIADGVLTGEVTTPIIDGKQKAEIVKKIAKAQGISLEETICIGDGANDLPMMAISDLGIAYHAKPIVQARADAAVNVTGLEGVLYALGYSAFTPIKA
ncbi:MAG: phosphoserine phosphatase SerB [Moraxella sp.]|nr:phosphoserine phosphatase SerB [Moraxella sp.]